MISEHILKMLQNLETSEEKLTALCKKYAELQEDHRTMQNTVKQNQRTITVVSSDSHCKYCAFTALSYSILPLLTYERDVAEYLFWQNFHICTGIIPN